MMIKSLTKVKPFELVSVVGSSFISAIAVFVTIDMTNPARAIVVSGDQSDYLAESGTGYDGVARLLIDRIGDSPTVGCTGSLLPTGLHILTAAHCFTQNTEDVPLGGTPGKFDTVSTIAIFESPILASDQRYGLFASEFYIHPDWNGDRTSGNDIAIIKLAQLAPSEIDRYDIYRATDELAQVVTKVGYGGSGNGNTGATIEDGRKRSGENTYEISWGNFLDALTPSDANPVFIPNTLREQTLGYDFDNGLVVNDLFGYLNIPNTGLGLNEVSIFEGDSGGPGFINNLIAGISSFGGTLGVVPPDVDNQLNGSFGEYAIDIRVSSYANYIDDVLADNIQPTYNVAVPESSTILGSILATSALAIYSLRKRH